MKNFWAALQFLTRLPVPDTLTNYRESLGPAIVAFPWAGLVIGLVLLLLHSAIAPLHPLVEAALLLIAWVWITGNLHIDGLADTADAWAGAGTDRDRALAIMKDPHCGPAGVSAIVLALLLKYALLVIIVDQGPVGALVVAPLFARTSLIILFLTTPYARMSGIVSPFLQDVPVARAWWSVIFACLLGVFIEGWPSIAALAIGASVLWFWRKSMLNRLGGMTGDTLGATVEIIEIAVLLAIYLTTYK